MGADWKMFENDADVLPNLRWMQTTSANPREEHKVFWSQKLTLPINDDFWNKHRPGDQWNCKCWLEQTDEEATKKADLPPTADMPEPKAGLKGNPAVTEEIFSQDHPHFPDKCSSCLINTDGKVHGLKKQVKNGPNVKGDCEICVVSKTCKSRIDKLNDPSNNKDLIPEEGYENSLFVHVNADENDKEANLIEAKHILEKGFSHLSAIIINEDIKEKNLPNQEYTFIYKDGRKLYGDRKGVQGENGITKSFTKAVNEQCDKVLVIEFNTQFKKEKIDLNECAKKLYWRIDDFKNDKIIECYFIRDDEVFLFDKEFMLSGTESEVKGRIIKKLAPIRTKKGG